MAASHRRVGPINLGIYGLLTPAVSGVSLSIAQAAQPEVSSGIYLGYPVLLASHAGAVLLLLAILSITDMQVVVASLGQCSKYSMLGGARTVTILLYIELLLSTLSWLAMTVTDSWGITACAIRSAPPLGISPAVSVL